ncbi:unnamed protein product [Anisakis simplex]|uniref:Protein kinase domain-containing protein n=1 Tax=Anisakis simplex TaxID=6269 RepID=A0A0M3JRX6_ANISI|nr:unnamed protein product [Anisakis simplex]
MLSLLSLILASGSVLRADTEQWSASTYPNPRTNSTQCNTWPNSTLCDPDHILTDQWRLNINENINHQIERLRTSNVHYVEDAPEECYLKNATEDLNIYVILAKKIQTQANHSTTDTDLTEFGDEIADEYGLNSLPCKNFLIIIGVEAAKLAYVRVSDVMLSTFLDLWKVFNFPSECLKKEGKMSRKDLKLPPNLMENVFNQYTGLFNAKNYMEGLNNVINEIGDQMIDPFKAQPATEMTDKALEIISTLSTTESSTSALVTAPISSATTNVFRQLAPWWMYALMIFAIVCAVVALFLLFMMRCQAKRCVRTQVNTVMSAIPEVNGSHHKTRACVNSTVIVGDEISRGINTGVMTSNSEGFNDFIVRTSEKSSNKVQNGASGDGFSSSVDAIHTESNLQSSKQTHHTLHAINLCTSQHKNTHSSDQMTLLSTSETPPKFSEILVEVPIPAEQQNHKNQMISAKLLNNNETNHRNDCAYWLRSNNLSPITQSTSMGSCRSDERKSTTSTENLGNTIQEEERSVAESDELEYSCEVVRPTTPPKVATKVHLNADNLSTDCITNEEHYPTGL